jgi:hypothetical protein
MEENELEFEGGVDCGRDLMVREVYEVELEVKMAD